MVLNILGAKVKIVIKEGMDDCGEAKFSQGEIWISSELKGKEKEQCLHHEIHHWILYRCGLDQGLSKEVIEAICDASGFVYSENNSLKSRTLL